MSLAYVARETRLSPTTIRYIGMPGNRHNESTLVALSAVLGWRYDHLINILRGTPDKNSPTSPAESHFLDQLHAEVGPIRENVAGLWDIVHNMDRKIDVIYQGWHGDTGRGDTGPGEQDT